MALTLKYMKKNVLKFKLVLVCCNYLKKKNFRNASQCKMDINENIVNGHSHDEELEVFRVAQEIEREAENLDSDGELIDLSKNQQEVLSEDDETRIEGNKCVVESIKFLYDVSSKIIFGSDFAIKIDNFLGSAILKVYHTTSRIAHPTSFTVKFDDYYEESPPINFNEVTKFLLKKIKRNETVIVEKVINMNKFFTTAALEFDSPLLATLDDHGKEKNFC
jgi:hypothetical protein